MAGGGKQHFIGVEGGGMEGEGGPLVIGARNIRGGDTSPDLPPISAWNTHVPEREPGSEIGRDRVVDNPVANRFFGMLSGFGQSPSFGFSAFGNTNLPTFWVDYPGVGNVPMAVPVGGWNPDGGAPGFKLSGHTPRLNPD